MSDELISPTTQIHELADKLVKLAEQIRNDSPANLGRALFQLEADEASFLDAVDYLLGTSAPISPRAERAQAMVAEAKRMSAEPHDWPQIDQDAFVITIDIDTEPEEDGRPYLVFQVGELVIYRRPTWYENADHIARVCRSLREAYKGRVKDLELTPAADNAIVMDDWSGYARLKKAFRPLRKDYERVRKQMKEKE